MNQNFKTVLKKIHTLAKMRKDEHQRLRKMLFGDVSYISLEQLAVLEAEPAFFDVAYVAAVNELPVEMLIATACAMHTGRDLLTDFGFEDKSSNPEDYFYLDPQECLNAPVEESAKYALLTKGLMIDEYLKKFIELADVNLFFVKICKVLNGESDDSKGND